MKDAATKSYLKKGQDIVDMNHKAIDIGATAYKKIDVPADWADAQDEADTRELQGRPEVVKMVKDSHGADRPHGRRLSAGFRFRRRAC